MGEWVGVCVLVGVSVVVSVVVCVCVCVYVWLKEIGCSDGNRINEICVDLDGFMLRLMYG